jgi:hypothetical protein
VSDRQGFAGQAEKRDRAAIDEFSTARICRSGGRNFPVLHQPAG